MNPYTLRQKLQKELKRRNAPIQKFLHSHNKFMVLNAGYEIDKLHVAKAYKCFIEDFQGNVYIDTALGAGTHLLGHAHPLIVREIKRQSREGTLYIMPNPHTYAVGKLLSYAIPHFSRFVFCNSGTEATMRAVRIARAFTGRKKIAMFSGGWHGGNDMLLFEDDYKSDENRPRPVFKSAGLPQELMNMILMLPYNSNRAFDLIEAHRKELAMVIIEPSQGSNPRDDIGAFLRKLRKITSKYGILLCFDEIITGFRIALGGGQEYYNLEVDLATYGKTLGGGLPIGLVAGKKEIMKVVEGDAKGKSVFMGGTFSANPLVMGIAKTVLQYLIKNKKNTYAHLNNNGRYIKNRINDFCIENQLPVRMIGIGSMLRLIFTDKPIKSRRERDRYGIDSSLQNLFYLFLLLEKGIFVNDNRIIFLSTQHKREHIEKIIKSITDSLIFFSDILKNFM